MFARTICRSSPSGPVIVFSATCELAGLISSGISMSSILVRPMTRSCSSDVRLLELGRQMPRRKHSSATAPPKQTSSRAEPAQKNGYDFKSEGKIPPPANGAAHPEADVEEMAVSDTTLDVSEADAPRDSTPTPATPSVTDSTADGFWIQIFASADRDVAENARSVASTRLNMPAYLDLDAGVYKVRVGDYTTRDAASETNVFAAWLSANTAAISSSEPSSAGCAA